MRISDWSSDVCSSDLVDDRLLQHLGHVAFDDAPRQALGQRGLAHAGLADVERVVLAPAAQHLDGALDLRAAADQRVDPAFLGEHVEVDRELGQRSEEHTSELQSLMSTSYAVFCLKK